MIVRCLRFLSLDAIYDNKRATAVVRNSDGTELYIHIFRDLAVPNVGVIVEVRKKRGCSYRFHKMARSILRAAQGITENMAGRQRKLVSSNLARKKISSNLAPCHFSVEHTMDLALESASSLLKKDRLDANLLGLESLVFLTDAESTGSPKALHASRAVLCEDVRPEGLKTSIKAFIQNDNRSHCQGAHEDHCSAMMRSHALAILANSIFCLSQNESELCTIVNDKEWISSDGFLGNLLEEIGHADTRPHDSYQAARCLNIIMSASSNFKEHAMKLGASNKLEMSYGVGNCRHALLASASKAALICMGAADPRL